MLVVDLSHWKQVKHIALWDTLYHAVHSRSLLYFLVNTVMKTVQNVM